MAKGAARIVQHRLGARMQALRADRELTQEVVADRIGISQKYLSELERGERSPSWETLVAIAHHGFEIRLAALMFGIDEDIPAEMLDLNEMLAGRPAFVPDLARARRLVARSHTRGMRVTVLTGHPVTDADALQLTALLDVFQART